jgi:16S rRNA G966 N2-methylase RsmD
MAIFSHLFSVFGDKIENMSVLDLYAGTCINSLEVISRGYKSVLGIEKNQTLVRNVRSEIRKILSDIELEKMKIICADVMKILKNKNQEKCFDIILVDPPFSYKTDIDEYKNLLRDGIWGKEDSLIVFHTMSSLNEHSKRYGSGYITYDFL